MGYCLKTKEMLIIEPQSQFEYAYKNVYIISLITLIKYRYYVTMVKRPKICCVHYCNILNLNLPLNQFYSCEFCNRSYDREQTTLTFKNQVCFVTHVIFYVSL